MPEGCLQRQLAVYLGSVVEMEEIRIPFLVAERLSTGRREAGWIYCTEMGKRVATSGAGWRKEERPGGSRLVVSSMPQCCGRCVMSQAKAGDIASWQVPVCWEKPVCQVTVGVLVALGACHAEPGHHPPPRLRPVTAAAASLPPCLAKAPRPKSAAFSDNQ